MATTVRLDAHRAIPSMWTAPGAKAITVNQNAARFGKCLGA